VAVDDEPDIGAADADIAQHAVIEGGELLERAAALEGAQDADDKRHHERMGPALAVGGAEGDGRHGKVLAELKKGADTSPGTMSERC
jgi:hypothetical protein